MTLITFLDAIQDAKIQAEIVVSDRGRLQPVMEIRAMENVVMLMCRPRAATAAVLPGRNLPCPGKADANHFCELCSQPMCPDCGKVHTGGDFCVRCGQFHADSAQASQGNPSPPLTLRQTIECIERETIERINARPSSGAEPKP